MEEPVKITGVKVDSKPINVPVSKIPEQKPKRERIEDILERINEDTSDLKDKVWYLINLSDKQKTFYIFDLKDVLSQDAKHDILNWITNMGGYYEKGEQIKDATLVTSIVFNAGDILYSDKLVKVVIDRRVINWHAKDKFVVELKLRMKYNNG